MIGGEDVTKLNFKNLFIGQFFIKILDIALQIEWELCVSENDHSRHSDGFKIRSPLPFRPGSNVTGNSG